MVAYEQLIRFGYDSAFVGTTIARESFMNDFGITSATKDGISSNITSAFQAGAFFGSLFSLFSEFSSLVDLTTEFC